MDATVFTRLFNVNGSTEMVLIDPIRGGAKWSQARSGYKPIRGAELMAAVADALVQIEDLKRGIDGTLKLLNSEETA